MTVFIQFGEAAHNWRRYLKFKCQLAGNLFVKQSRFLPAPQALRHQPTVTNQNAHQPIIVTTDKPLTDKEYLLQKFAGKGGWTYAEIPEILKDKHAHFGWVRVRGSIDHFEIRSYHLMPMGNGKLFLPVKAAIRKAINKKAGDLVHVTLFADNEPVEIPEELKLCLMDEERGLEVFRAYSYGEQKAMINWIYAAKREETRIERIARTMDKIAKGQKLNDRK